MIWIGLKKKEMSKIRPIKNTWYDWLVNCIPDPIRKSVSAFKDKTVSLFKANTPKHTAYERGKKLSKSKKQNIKKSFISKEKKNQGHDN